jgi:flagellar hook assembly protein FlgD
MSGACTIVGLFRDENMAIMFKNDKEKELAESNGNNLPDGRYEIWQLVTDIDVDDIINQIAKINRLNSMTSHNYKIGGVTRH